MYRFLVKHKRKNDWQNKIVRAVGDKCRNPVRPNMNGANAIDGAENYSEKVVR